MPKPAPHRLELARYPHQATLQTRFGDMDVLGHLNNVAYAALFENGRVRFNRSFDSRSHRAAGARWLVASLGIEYLAEGHFPDDVVMGSGIGRIGRSSWTIEQGLFQGGRAIATADTVLVYSGREGTLPLPPGFVAELERLRVLAV